MSRMKTMLAMLAEASTVQQKPTTKRQRIDLKQKKERLNQKKGLTEYFYGENSLWALNDKNAERKAKKKGWI